MTPTFRHILVAAAMLTGIFASAQPSLPTVSPSPGDDNFNVEHIRERLSDTALHRIEGIWQLTHGGATIAIEREPDSDAETYSIRIIQSPDRLVKPGTLLGRAERSGNSSLYLARLYTRTRAGRPYYPKSFSLKFNDDESRLDFMRHKTTLRINLWHFVPFLYRNSVRTYDPDRSAHAGCVRLFPAPEIPVEPIHL